MELDAGEPGPALLEGDAVVPEEDCLLVDGREDDDVVDPCQVDVGGELAPELVDEHVLEPPELKDGLKVPLAEQQGLAADHGLLPVEGRHLLEVRHPDLHHLEHPVIKGPPKDQVVRPLFGVRANDKARKIVLFDQKLERGHVLKRPVDLNFMS